MGKNYKIMAKKVKETTDQKEEHPMHEKALGVAYEMFMNSSEKELDVYYLQHIDNLQAWKVAHRDLAKTLKLELVATVKRSEFKNL